MAARRPAEPSRPAAVADAAQAPPDRKYLLERVDDAAVVQLYADGFNQLPREQKLLIWHLYEAALAGRDIYYDQRYAHNLEMRDVLEEIITHPQGIDEATLAEITRYTKLFWLNTGPYNNLTARKFVLKSTPEAFAAAARAAQKAGAKFPLKKGETLEALLERMQPLFFDPDRRSNRYQQDARPGEGHPPGERQQSLCRRHHEGPRGVQGALCPQLPRRQEGRQAGRGGLPRRRPLRQGDPRHRRASRGGDPLRDADDEGGDQRAGQVLSHR